MCGGSILKLIALQNLIAGIHAAIFIIFLFQVKHLVVDFFLQPPYMWKNKGKLFHPGGWLHAGLHGATTFGVLYLLAPAAPEYAGQLAKLAAAEVLAHFLIDMFKVRVCAWRGWTPTTSPRYWYMLGLDQFLHQLCYLVITLVWLTTSP